MNLRKDMTVQEQRDTRVESWRNDILANNIKTLRKNRAYYIESKVGYPLETLYKMCEDELERRLIKHKQYMRKMSVLTNSIDIDGGVRTIQKLVCEYYDLKREDILEVLPRGGNAKSENRERNKARHIAVYLSRQFTSLSFTQLATAFNRLDHTTMMYSANLIPKKIREGDELLKREVQDLTDILPHICML